MKKILLPIFGGFLLTSSISLTTGQNVNVVIKQKEQEKIKKQELLNSWFLVNKERNLSEKQINIFKRACQNWDTTMIDNMLNQALCYNNDQLTIDKDKLDISKLPPILLENINLILDNLNNAVSLGFIKIYIIDGNIKLIYQNNNSIDGIIAFDNLSSNAYSNAYSSYMWYSTYGPSHWWKFWEWGGYIHFSETAVHDANALKKIASIINIFFLLNNLSELSNIVKTLSSALKVGNIDEVNKVIKELAILLGIISLDFLGSGSEILAIFTAIIAFVIAIQSSPFLVAIFELFTSLIISVISLMQSADRGNGVKWQWYNFVVPGVIWAE